ncbi:transcriptional repressor [Cupriavidus pinatubonensis]|uniref:Fur family transcriptional regulator n=1 Tax=Cupriavidus pinatubonensis TaxID=248026 RepID=UPI00112E4816|nr:Fur family transcriptional regulator [Cupriavidus pinatubonensis]QYY31788.1 transcriptional repressor [Cupriavidus pinatubonensis]TPQ40739.1 transcriptional repressor [Cupriavidus pinatubonensis]
MTSLTPSQPDSAPAPAVLEAAQERLRRLGARVTQPRLCILACLIGSNEPLTHQAVIDRLPGQGEAIDRVTVYRVLDWLVEQGVAQKRAGNDRVFRFSLVEHEAARAEVHRQHSHFHCTRCDRTFCLDDVGLPAQPAAPRVPSGFAIEHVELTVNGVCAECGARVARQPDSAT